MRAVMLFVVALCAAGLSSCDGDREPRSEDTLVLELGGDHGSLRGALLRAGVVIVPRPDRTEAPVHSMRQILGAEAPLPVDPDVNEVPQPQPEPQPEPSAYREIELRAGETISHLSSIHLGTVRRYREILELNSWTEEESRRLPIGTKVKIPSR